MKFWTCTGTEEKKEKKEGKNAEVVFTLNSLVTTRDGAYPVSNAWACVERCAMAHA